jgi:molybdate transport system substrate-binding protein
MGGLLFVILSAGHFASATPPELLVSAASDLTKALTDIGKLYEQKKPVKVRFNFGSTGKLAQQIEQGAPVDVFFAADIAAVNDLEKKRLIVPGTKKRYARGRITLWTRADSPLKVKSVNDLTRAAVQRIAIANPEHAPYGRAARQALTRAGVWDKVRDKIVYGDNIAQTLQYAQTGNADVAIVALSLSVGSPGQWVLIPETLHQPIDQSLAVIKGSKHPSLAKDFAAFVNGKDGRPILRKYGFILPGEEKLMKTTRIRR